MYNYNLVFNFRHLGISATNLQRFFFTNGWKCFRRRKCFDIYTSCYVSV